MSVASHGKIESEKRGLLNMTLEEIYKDLKRLKSELSSHDIKVKKDLDLQAKKFLEEAKENLDLTCNDLLVCLAYDI